MVKSLGVMIILDVFAAAILVGFLYRDHLLVKSCSKQLFAVGIGYFSYVLFFLARNIILVCACSFSRSPDSVAFVGRSIGCIIDFFCLTTFLIWSSVILHSEDAHSCTTQYHQIRNWWLTCLITTVFGWIYASILCIIFLVACPVCSFYVILNAISGGDRESMERIPIANSVITRLKNEAKIFTKLKE